MAKHTQTQPAQTRVSLGLGCIVVSSALFLFFLTFWIFVLTTQLVPALYVAVGCIFSAIFIGAVAFLTRCSSRIYQKIIGYVLAALLAVVCVLGGFALWRTVQTMRAVSDTTVERSVVSCGSVQAAYLENGCSWITLFIAMAPSLGFLGTVIGMVMAFDDIERAGDISPTIVAGGMKVALITTIFGLIVAMILQVFYNYILSKIETITNQMEDASIVLLDLIMKYNLKYKK